MDSSAKRQRRKALVRHLESRILRGDFLPGARLPAQRHLAQRLGVARSSVREALTELESRGILEVRHGSGARVKNLLANHFPGVGAEEATPDLQRQVLEAREVLEGEAAAGAARHATAKERELLAAEYARVRARAQGETTLRKAKADLRFHQLVADCSHSLLIIGFSRLLYERYFHVIYAVLSATLARTGAYPPGIARQHARIHEAIQKGEAAAARQAAAEHVAYTRNWLMGRG